MKILVKIKRQKRKTKYKKQGISDFDCFKMITTGRLFEICYMEYVRDILRKFFPPKSFYIYLFKNPCIHYFLLPLVLSIAQKWYLNYLTNYVTT